MKLFYKNNLSSLSKLASDIDDFSEQNNIPPAISYSLNLCLDEVLTNIISYNQKDQSLPESSDSSIEVELSNSNNQVSAIIRDSGIPFNPLENTPHTPDLGASIEDRPIGGLGVYFLEQYMDKVEYKREDDHNVLMLSKCIK